ncbi:hypothetical protein AB1Y20_020630 [Prymnesium parvum]|uniref:tRNA threonylcarbamoyladenosine biosynthesis protein TsaE n=1 Tax=Prymnesium parvum TaxID=97485 RepID=A0AB34JZX7_PRYPA
MLLLWPGAPRARLVASAVTHSRLLPTRQDTLDLGARLADLALPGDALLLHGSYGAGKTCLARGFLQRWFASPDELVTSPSYLIDNVYPDDGRARLRGVAVHHLDLWRLPEGKIAQLVDLPAVFADAVSLIEWPERLGARLTPPEHLALRLVIAGEGEGEEQPRLATFEAHGARWAERLPALLG